MTGHNFEIMSQFVLWYENSFRTFATAKTSDSPAGHYHSSSVSFL